MSNPTPLPIVVVRPQGHHARINPALYPALEDLRAFARPGGSALIDRVYEEALRLHQVVKLYSDELDLYREPPRLVENVTQALAPDLVAEMPSSFAEGEDLL